jgi:ABC-type uncharacterized transport system involved in gliding motility auxiliary subunit
VLRDLDDVVRVTLYASSELPAQLQPVLRDVQDLLRDYDSIGGRDLALEVVRPAGSRSDEAEEARSRGVQEVQFNVVGNDEFALRQGFLGITVAYGAEREAIAFIQDTGDLEYQLTSLVTQLAVEDKPTVGMLVLGGDAQPSIPGMAPGGEQAGPSLRALQQELQRQFEVRQLATDELASQLEEVQTLLVAGSGGELDTSTRDAIVEFLDAGGSALMLVDGVGVDLRTGQATAAPEGGLVELLERWGVQVRPQLAYDLRANTTATFGGGGGFNYAVPYALWPRASASQEHPTSRGIESVSLQWASPIRLDDATIAELGLESTSLLRTTEQAGVMEEPFDINPQQQFSRSDLRRQVLAVALAPQQEGREGDGSTAPPRLVVVGDSDFVDDQFVQGAGGGGVPLVLQSVSWLSQSTSLASIRIKAAGERRLQFEDAATQGRIRWGNMLGAVLVVALLGAWRLGSRRRLSRHTYQSRPPKAVLEARERDHADRRREAA